MARMGMDVDLVEDAGRELQERARSLDAIVARIDQTVGSLTACWDGKDAQRFVNDWWPEHKSKLAAVSLSIAGLGQSALNNASEQRDVSGGAGASVGSGAATSGSGSFGATDGATIAGGATATAVGSSLGSQPGSTSVGALTPGAGLAGYTAAVGNIHDEHADPYGAYSGNCTSWAAYRRHELDPSIPARESGGGTGMGFQMAGKVGGTSDTPPSLGALVSTPDNGMGGHVMVVEEIFSPTSFRVSEMNIAGQLGMLRTDTVWTQQDGVWTSNHGGRETSLVIAGMPTKG